MEARSIAVLGASGDAAKVGGRPIAYLQRMGYEGRVVPINPRRAEIGGLASAPHIAAAGAVDLAIIAAPTAGKIDLVRDAIAAGVKAIVLFSAGFGEVDEAGRALQHEAAELASNAGVVLLGPNCLGVISTPNKLVATFTTALEQTLPACGGFSYAGQSGALGAYWLDQVAGPGLGVARWISTGNEAQVGMADALAYLADDPATRVIGAYIEDIKAPDLFADAVARARAAGKTILAIKSGRSPAGARAVRGHTGADAGDAEHYAGLLREHGIVQVRSLSEMVSAAQLLFAAAPPCGSKLGIVTVSGGAGVLLCDAAADAGLIVPELSGATGAKLRAVLPAFASALNPVDVTGAVVSNDALMPDVMSIMTAALEFDTVVLFLGAMSSIADNLVRAVVRARAEQPTKPIVVVWMGGPPASCAALRALDVPVFNEIPQAIVALAHTKRS